jgi:hypothetical protein
VLFLEVCDDLWHAAVLTPRAALSVHLRGHFFTATPGFFIELEKCGDLSEIVARADSFRWWIGRGDRFPKRASDTNRIFDTEIESAPTADITTVGILYQVAIHYPPVETEMAI